MPYFLRGDCVVKGTRENPGDVVKCHDSHADAVAHIRALYANVEDAVKKCLRENYARQRLADLHGLSSSLNYILLGMSIHKGNMHEQVRSLESLKDRWIAVSTREEWDKEDEMFTVQAMDYDIARVQKTKDFPEFRMYHVRGFKLGMCDEMTRNKDRAVDKGYWFDTPFANAVRELVAANKGKWKISRGFYSLEATGLCRGCSKDLMVRPINYIFGVVCPSCKEYHPKASLSKTRHLKAITFDISVTDVPAVASTAVAAYSMNK